MEINGRNIADDILIQLTKRVARLRDTFGMIPHLAVIRVGDDPAITSYIKQKELMAKRIGAIISVYNHPINVTQKELYDEIRFLQQDTHIDGLLLQLPLPQQLDEKALLSTILPDKDVDGFHSETYFVVPVAAAVITMLQKAYEFKNPLDNHDFFDWLRHQQIVILGKGKTGGKPVIDLLRKMNIEPDIIDSTTREPEKIIQKADIIISAVGKREVVKPYMLKKNVILIGIGLSRDDKGIFGDYDVEQIKDIASFYTPSPKGVGPVNVAKLMENLVIAAERQIVN